MKLTAGLILLCGLGPLSFVRAETSDAYHRELEAWRAQRVAQLTAPDGWLTLIGLDFLSPGDSTIGSARDNRIILAAGPAHLGVVHLDEGGGVKLKVNPGVDAQVDGRTVLAADLDDGRMGRPTLVTSGTMSFYVIDRGGKRALRVRDSAADRRTHFQGLDYFPTDPSWRIEGKWVRFEKPRQIPIKSITGQESSALVLGKVVFTRDGRTFTLLPIQEGLGEPLFFIFTDQTGGKTTYEAARFLYADYPASGVVVLDFNKAINPPCAFTPFATCPLPPEENRLPIAVAAGEKAYRGEGK
jgi:uncharacterized protein (DUF1684 family)